MNSCKVYLLLVVFLFTFSFCSKRDVDTDMLIEDLTDETYFPPINSTEWETKSIAALNWNDNKLQPLLHFLEEKNTKSFIILYNGKIVVEEYFNNHTATSSWYWASAGKTLTTTAFPVLHKMKIF